MRPPRIKPNYTPITTPLLSPGRPRACHAERPEQDLRMSITGGQQLEEEWFAGGRAVASMGGHQQVARAHAIPQAVDARSRGEI